MILCCVDYDNYLHQGASLGPNLEGSSIVNLTATIW